ncbi:uncharacterized protein LOC129727527 isoform X2 [Wyeomyia smithii]|uniref:uncharacterized protein LOC129727527 isoform X2 n=1 Tax=Wyeomyia smithii TaxID=174621 RepID=UPI0024682039|nr:uncharacterized protein LOC129727527 isoform X2 [Wyeomyia smithii]
MSESFPSDVPKHDDISNNQNLDIEYLDADSRFVHWADNEIIQLLQSFKVSTEVIQKFVVDEYDINTLRVIERKEIEDLVGDPHLADRTKIIHGLNFWRQSQNLPVISSVCCGISNKENLSGNISNQSQKVERYNCTATVFLQNSVKALLVPAYIYLHRREED